MTFKTGSGGMHFSHQYFPVHRKRLIPLDYSWIRLINIILLVRQGSLLPVNMAITEQARQVRSHQVPMGAQERGRQYKPGSNQALAPESALALDSALVLVRQIRPSILLSSNHLSTQRKAAISMARFVRPAR